MGSVERWSQNAERQVLDAYAGIAMADGYGAYNVPADADPGFTLSHCWAGRGSWRARAGRGRGPAGDWTGERRERGRGR